MNSQNLMLDQNLVNCLKTKEQWGHDIVYNICTNTQTIVPWGLGDYAGAFFIGFLILLLTGMLVGVVGLILDGY